MAEAMEGEDSYLLPEHEDLPILALRMGSRTKLGLYLDIEAAQPLQNGLLPDFKGLAECVGFGYIEICNFARDRKPTICLLHEWGNRPDMKPTLGNLVEYLKQLERVDVLEDCKDTIRRDAEDFLEKKSGELSVKPVQDQTVSQSPYDIDDMSVDETQIMTVQDVAAGCPTYYDAFVCYNPEGEDLTFVKLMIEKLENRENGLKLFVPHRDDLPGASKHVISAKLIQERCKRMVIVMSPRYLQSDACDFQTKFAHALSPGSRSKKLVPVLISYCKTPNILHHVTMCDYTRGDLTGWFWERLYRSLQAPLNPQEITIQNPNCLTDLQMKLVAQSQRPSLPPSNSQSKSTQQFASGGSSQRVSRQASSASSSSSQQMPSGIVRTTSGSSLSSTSSTSPTVYPQLSLLPSQQTGATNTGTATQPVSGSPQTSTQPLVFHQGASGSGRVSPHSLPTETPSTHMASGVQETSFSNSAPGSPSQARKGLSARKKRLLSKLTQVFSSSQHSNC